MRGIVVRQRGCAHFGWEGQLVLPLLLLVVLLLLLPVCQFVQH